MSSAFFAVTSALTSPVKNAKDGSMFRILFAAAVLSCLPAPAQAEDLIHTFKKVRLTDQFWAEGAAIGDFNNDGAPDLAVVPDLSDYISVLLNTQ